jgi:peroxiredoxin
MKYFKSLFVLTVFLLAVHYNTMCQEKNAYRIALNIKGLKDSTCYLAHYYRTTKSQIVKDTTKADAHGNIVFEGTETLPAGIYLIAIGKSHSIQLLVPDQHVSLLADTTYALNAIKVLDGKENKLFYTYQNTLNATISSLKEVADLRKTNPADKALEQKFTKLQDQLTAFQEDFFAKNKDSFCAQVLQATLQPKIPEAPKLANGKPDSTFALRYMQNHYFDKMDLSNEMFIKTPFIEDRINYYLDNLNYQVPDSLYKAVDKIMAKTSTTKTMQKFLASHIGSRYERPSFMGGDAVFAHVAEKYFKNMPANWDSATLAAVEEKRIAVKNVLIGAKAYNAMLTDTTGRTVLPLHQVKAKYTLLFIYDPDCGHCKERAPHILALYNKLKTKDLKVYAASTVANVPKIKEFIKNQKTKDFINVYDGRSVTDFKKYFDVFTTPQVMLLDANKKIIGRGLNDEQLEDLIMRSEKGAKP